MRLKVMQLPVRTYPGRAPYAVVLGGSPLGNRIWRNHERFYYFEIPCWGY